MLHMIPTDWVPYRREHDDELVGYLARQDGGVVPMTLFGYPMAAAGSAEEAQEMLESTGLSVLADHWWLQLEEGGSVRVAICEVTPERVVVMADDFGYGGDMNDAWTLHVPESGRLSR
jgi:predicted ABC-type transport system involved in lysophospholipase L1 biosynthesis ATPase subunit